MQPISLLSLLGANTHKSSRLFYIRKGVGALTYTMRKLRCERSQGKWLSRGKGKGSFTSNLMAEIRLGENDNVGWKFLVENQKLINVTPALISKL